MNLCSSFSTFEASNKCSSGFAPCLAPSDLPLTPTSSLFLLKTKHAYSMVLPQQCFLVCSGHSGSCTMFVYILAQHFAWGKKYIFGVSSDQPTKCLEDLQKKKRLRQVCYLNPWAKQNIFIKFFVQIILYNEILVRSVPPILSSFQN